jgi:hypothetical protein
MKRVNPTLAALQDGKLQRRISMLNERSICRPRLNKFTEEVES